MAIIFPLHQKEFCDVRLQLDLAVFSAQTSRN